MEIDLNAIHSPEDIKGYGLPELQLLAFRSCP
jgi:hypothetical protein